jgi:hypothetical protein
MPSYSFYPSIGASGGLLVMWDNSVVKVWSSISVDHVLMVHGRFLKSNEEFHLFNVYAPWDNGEKQLWNSLIVRLQQMVGRNICICGDFNAVRKPEERRVRGSQFVL